MPARPSKRDLSEVHECGLRTRIVRCLEFRMLFNKPARSARSSVESTYADESGGINESGVGHHGMTGLEVSSVVVCVGSFQSEWSDI